MTETDANLSLALLNALKAFDRKTLPLGLYACEEYRVKDKPYQRLHQEWHLCLKPCLEALGCRTGWANIRNGEFSFNMPGGTRAEIRIVRTSNLNIMRTIPQNEMRRWEDLLFQEGPHPGADDPEPLTYP